MGIVTSTYATELIGFQCPFLRTNAAIPPHAITVPALVVSFSQRRVTLSAHDTRISDLNGGFLELLAVLRRAFVTFS